MSTVFANVATTLCAPVGGFFIYQRLAQLYDGPVDEGSWSISVMATPL